jgi:hypothetical protein
MHAGDDHDDPPMADPKIRSEYEAALGRFLVAFNRVDNELTELIALALAKLGRFDLFVRCAEEVDFNRKLFHLELLSLSTEGKPLHGLPIKEMKELAGRRNILAHGHFDQNPFQGNYTIKNKGQRAPFSATVLGKLTKRCDVVWEKLRDGSAGYWFENLDAVPPSGAP